jgi:hypothetical protein
MARIFHTLEGRCGEILSPAVGRSGSLYSGHEFGKLSVWYLLYHHAKCLHCNRSARWLRFTRFKLKPKPKLWTTRTHALHHSTSAAINLQFFILLVAARTLPLQVVVKGRFWAPRAFTRSSVCFHGG